MTKLAARIFLVTFAMSSILSSKTTRWCRLPSTQLAAQAYVPLTYRSLPPPRSFHQPRNHFKASGKRVNGPHRAYSHQTNLCDGNSNPITALVQDTAKASLKSNLTDNPTTLVVGVSGGCDSVALLHALASIDVTSAHNIVAVHFHHHQRPVDADLDCQLVQEMCESYDIPLKIFHWGQDEYSSSLADKAFSQAAARQWRSQVLESVARDSMNTNTKQEEGKAYILTAHHKDDSNESMLLKILRGVWMPNIQGMSEITESSPANNISYLRPFLSLSKQSLIDYLNAHSIQWREDASNASNKYLRNRIRNQLVPLLQDLMPSFQDRLDDYQFQAKLIQEDLQPRVDAYLEKVLIITESGNRLFQIDREAFPSDLVLITSLHQWISKEATERKPVFISFSSLRRLVAQLQEFPNRTQWTIEIGNGMKIVRKGTILMFDHGNVAEASVESLSVEVVKEVIDVDAPSSSRYLYFALPPAEAERNIIFCSLKDWKGPSLQFRPAWRGSLVKLRAFLRGQGLKEAWKREHAQVIGVEGTSTCLAVQVDGKWLISGDYDTAGSHVMDKGRLTVKVSKPKASS